MAMKCTIWPPNFMLTILLCSLVSTLGEIRKDPQTIGIASNDYGHIVTEAPNAVLYPSSYDEIVKFVKSTYDSSTPSTIAARGRSHSVHGQALAKGGVVVNMTALAPYVKVVQDGKGGASADVGGHMLWIDVLTETLKSGFAPVTFTDYLYLTVGGTLSNAGIGGQTFRFGPQISNVLDMDVITGTGEVVTCSPTQNPNLYHAVLGGLGQFGIITRARIPLRPTPKQAKWVRLLYSNFSSFTEDQERLISINGGNDKNALDYLEGMLFLNKLGEPDPWRSYFTPEDQAKISSLIVSQNGIIYCIELAKFYDDGTKAAVEQALSDLFKELRFLSGYNFVKDVSTVDFLNRVYFEEVELRKHGLWEVHHPWLNLFIPKSGVSAFNEGCFRNIMLKHNITVGPVLFYPMNRTKWDDKTSAVIADGEIFYTLGLLHAAVNAYKAYEDQNQEMLHYCETAGIKVKKYLGYEDTQQGWIDHFGDKWKTFQERKREFDPKNMLSPGQKIFNR